MPAQRRLPKVGVTAEQVDLVSPSGQFARITEAVAKYAGIPMAYPLLTVQKHTAI